MKYIFLLLMLVFGVFTLYISQRSILLHSISNSVLKPESENTTTILLGGDVMLGRSVTVQSLDKQSDPNYPFLGISKIGETADIFFINLENPIVDKCPRRVDGMVFCAPPEMLEGLRFANVHIVNLSNNHTLNYGQGGLENTKVALGRLDIKYSDNTRLEVIERNNLKFGFLGFDRSQQINPKLTEEEIDLIEQSAKTVDFLVVAMHWGVEYKDKPSEGQESLAKDLVSYGVDLIVGHHPHWTQDLQFIEQVPVYYSLGNLVFDQMWSERTKMGLIAKIVVDSKGEIVAHEELPTYIEKQGQPIIIPSPKL